MTNTPTPDHAQVNLSDDPDYMTVWFSWKVMGPLGEVPNALDRPVSQGMSCLPRHVPRLIRAFLEGALFPNPEVKRDIYNQTFVAANCAVYGKRINADLTALGY